MFKFKNTKYNQLKLQLASFENDLKELEKNLNKIPSKYLTIDDAKNRDYIVRNNYIGKVKDELLIEDFKLEIERTLGDTFESVCLKLLNFQLLEVSKFRAILNNYEIKQIVLDTYRKPKTIKAKQE